MVVSAVHARQEGIFQIDLQLRPYGKAGSMAVSLESFRRYYAPEGPAWAYERQALVKLRPIADDPALGAELCRLRDEYVYHGGAFDVTAMRAMRERQIRHLVRGAHFNAKFSPGGLVDVEYLIQGLQINHGARHPALRVTNLREAMTVLYQAGILSEADYTTLRKAHTFLRWLIDSLRVVRGNATRCDRAALRKRRICASWRAACATAKIPPACATTCCATRPKCRKSTSVCWGRAV